MFSEVTGTALDIHTARSSRSSCTWGRATLDLLSQLRREPPRLLCGGQSGTELGAGLWGQTTAHWEWGLLGTSWGSLRSF